MNVPVFLYTNNKKNVMNQLHIETQDKKAKINPASPFGIIQNTSVITINDTVIDYRTTLNDTNIRKIRAYIYRFYIPYNDIRLKNKDICITSAKSIYNLSKNRQYDILKVTEKFIDFHTDPEQIIKTDIFEPLQGELTQNIDTLLISFGYIDSKYYLYQDKRQFNPLLCQSLNETNNQIQTIQNSQIQWDKWENWNTQNNWYLTSHKKLTNYTEQSIYEAIPKTNTNSKLYIRNKFKLKSGKKFNYTIKTRVFEDKKCLFKLVIKNINQNLIIFEEVQEVTLYKEKWQLLNFNFICLYDIELNDIIEIQLEIINYKDKIIQFTEPQFEENDIYSPFINGEREKKNIYYTSQYYQSYFENENYMYLYITPDINSVYSQQKENRLILYYFRYNQEFAYIECYKKNIQQDFNNINSVDKSQLDLIKHVPINNSLKNNKNLKFKASNIIFKIDISKIQDENCNSIDDLFTKIYKNKFELSFLQSFNTNNKLYTQTYPYLDRSFIYPDLGNNIDGKLVETTNIHLEEINKNDEYDGEFIV